MTPNLHILCVFIDIYIYTFRSSIFIHSFIYFCIIPSDAMGLHRVENASHTDKAVSLHLYCPPFEECSTFNQQTGHETMAKSAFWSIYGEKVSKVYTHNSKIVCINTYPRQSLVDNKI